MGYEQMQNNKVFLTGRIVEEPVFSHEMMGEGFYDFSIAVKRLSGQDDIIPMTISERLMLGTDFDEGNVIGAVGQFRSYNKIVDEKSKLVLRVFVRELVEPDDTNPNIIELEGFVCKQPVYRQTPFKREIADMLIAVNRAYNKSDYIPAIAWGRNARFAGGFSVGDKVHVVGRIQSRVYQKQLEGGIIEDRTAYEVSISKLDLLSEKPRSSYGTSYGTSYGSSYGSPYGEREYGAERSYDSHVGYEQPPMAPVYRADDGGYSDRSN